jgi:large subunit ribosomal protein L15
MPLVRRLPKHGFRRPDRVACEIVNVGQLAAFGEGATVEPEALLRHGLIRGSGAPVKILGQGEPPRSLVVRAQRVSTGARQKIEAAGGRVEILE